MKPVDLVASDWTLIYVLAAPHLLYAFIWFFPHLWLQAFKKKGVEVFESIAWALKVAQFSTVVVWFYTRQPKGIDLLAISPIQFAISLALGIAGQALNIGIFKAIGHNGVYYGFKLGHTIPWVDGFPFNVVSHPQYVGSVLSIWSALVLTWNQAPSGLGLIAAYWTMLYIITGWMESSLHV